MPLHTPLQLDLHEYEEVKNTLKRWLKTNPGSSQDQKSNWKPQMTDKNLLNRWQNSNLTNTMPQHAILMLRLRSGPCVQLWHHCIAYCHRLLSGNALSPVRRGRGSMGCLGRWSAIKSWVNIQDLHTDQRNSQTSNCNDTKPQWAVSTLPYISLLTGWYPSAMHMHDDMQHTFYEWSTSPRPNAAEQRTTATSLTLLTSWTSPHTIGMDKTCTPEQPNWHKCPGRKPAAKKT